jgi:hypothetical protein
MNDTDQQRRKMNNSVRDSAVNESEPVVSKQPFHKKWWSYLAIVAIIIPLAACAGQSNSDPEKVDENNSSSSSSSESPEDTVFKVGDVIAYDGQEILVESVERNYTIEYSNPDEGKEYVKVNIQIENKSDERISYNSYNWELEDSTGDIQDPAIQGSMVDDYLSHGELASGGKKSGSLIFEVPKDDTKLILYYKSSLWSDDSIEIQL